MYIFRVGGLPAAGFTSCQAAWCVVCSSRFRFLGKLYPLPRDCYRSDGCIRGNHVNNNQPLTYVQRLATLAVQNFPKKNENSCVNYYKTLITAISLRLNEGEMLRPQARRRDIGNRTIPPQSGQPYSNAFSGDIHASGEKRKLWILFS